MKQFNTTRNSLRAKLLEKGLSLTAWEREKGYGNGVVRVVVSRFAGKDARPNGGQSLEIIEALEAETGIRICG